MPCPTKGHLEFDFVSGYRPPFNDLYKLDPLPDTKFLKILNNCCLVSITENNKYIRWLSKINKDCKENMRFPSGNEAFHARSPPAGEQVFVAMERFYNNLQKRAEACHLGASAAEVPFDHMDIFESLKVFAKQAEVYAHDESDSEEDNENEHRKTKRLSHKPHRKASLNASTRASIVVKNDHAPLARGSSVRMSISSQVEDHGAARAPLARGSSVRMSFSSQVQDALNHVQNLEIHGPAAVGLVPGGVENNDDIYNKYAIAVDDSDVCVPTRSKLTTNNCFNSARRGNVFVFSSLSGNVVIYTNGNGDSHFIHHTRDGSVSKAVKDVAAVQLAKRVSYKRFLMHAGVSAAAKASRVFDALETALLKIYITSRQLALIVLLFPQGKIWKAEYFGTYRVELIITVLHRIVDMHNFDVVLYYLTTDEIACVYCRLGWLNIYNPMKPEVIFYVFCNCFRRILMFMQILLIGILSIKSEISRRQTIIEDCVDVN